MRISDEVFERLKLGEDLDAVRASYRSMSQYEDGCRRYSVLARAVEN